MICTHWKFNNTQTQSVNHAQRLHLVPLPLQLKWKFWVSWLIVFFSIFIFLSHFIFVLLSILNWFAFVLSVCVLSTHSSHGCLWYVGIVSVCTQTHSNYTYRNTRMYLYYRDYVVRHPSNRFWVNCVRPAIEDSFLYLLFEKPLHSNTSNFVDNPLGILMANYVAMSRSNIFYVPKQRREKTNKKLAICKAR